MEALVDTRSAAALLGVSTRTVYVWVERGELPHIRVGRLVRFRPADLARWVEDRAFGGRP
jgi:excisionase family DNA binding protein